MASKSAYKEKMDAINQKMLEVGMDTGFQKAWDLLQLALHDHQNKTRKEM